jgi:uncharacterized membrane protein (UPF0127 family)
MDVHTADTALRRLRGMLGHREPPAHALRLEPCRCVHTFGMRFALDLRWYDRDGRLLRVDEAVPPWRVRACRGAHAVVEIPVSRLSSGRCRRR